jgi:5-methylcytosine-specific restriction protein A
MPDRARRYQRSKPAKVMQIAPRGNSADRGYDHRWRKYRLAFLAEHPCCVECRKLGLSVEATVVDHIIPHRGDYELFWEPKNHQALCDTHHNRKTGRGE